MPIYVNKPVCSAFRLRREACENADLIQRCFICLKLLLFFERMRKRGLCQLGGEDGFYTASVIFFGSIVCTGWSPSPCPKASSSWSFAGDARAGRRQVMHGSKSRRNRRTKGSNVLARRSLVFQSRMPIGKLSNDRLRSSLKSIRPKGKPTSGR